MRLVFYVLGGFVVLLAAGGVYGYLRLKRYLARSQGGVENTMSDIVEEIDSYQEKTQ